jgi:inosine-uridine nucleoside N-ribohydrolase
LHQPVSQMLMAVDITYQHSLSRSAYTSFVAPYLSSNSPLAEWVTAFLSATFNKLDSLYSKDAPLALHDPLCIWYLLARPPMTLSSKPEDIRIETSGQWTRGMCVVDKRPRDKSAKTPPDGVFKVNVGEEDMILDEVPGDSGRWLTHGAGNRVWRCVDSVWKESFGIELLKRMFG